MATEPKVHPDGRIVVEKREHIYLIGIDRPAKLNGFTNKMLDELAKAYTAYDEGPWRCAVVYPTGKHFTAGLDLAKIDRGRTLFPRALVDPVGLHPPIRTKPVVIGVRGITFTIGFEIALAGDIIICGSDARIAQLEVKRGLMPTCGGTARMIERASWGNAMRYLLTGDEMSAEDALRMGLVQEIVAPDAVVTRAIELAERIAKQAPMAVKAVLKDARTALTQGIDASTAGLAEASGVLRDSVDVQEGVRSFIEKRQANFQGR